jgi:hypothetical protein
MKTNKILTGLFLIFFSVMINAEPCPELIAKPSKDTPTGAALQKYLSAGYWECTNVLGETENLEFKDNRQFVIHGRSEKTTQIYDVRENQVIRRAADGNVNIVMFAMDVKKPDSVKFRVGLFPVICARMKGVPPAPVVEVKDSVTLSQSDKIKEKELYRQKILPKIKVTILKAGWIVDNMGCIDYQVYNGSDENVKLELRFYFLNSAGKAISDTKDHLTILKSNYTLNKFTFSDSSTDLSEWEEGKVRFDIVSLERQEDAEATNSMVLFKRSCSGE